MCIAPWGRRNFLGRAQQTCPPTVSMLELLTQFFVSASVRKSYPCSYTQPHQDTFEQDRKSGTVTFWRICAVEHQQHEKNSACVFLQAINLKGSSYNFQILQPVLGSFWAVSSAYSSIMTQNSVSPLAQCTVITIFTSWPTLEVFSSLFSGNRPGQS